MKDSYEAFSAIIPWDDFCKLLNILGLEQQKEFGRASLMYQQAMKCRPCNSDISLAQLCSAVEIVSDGKNITYKDWLIDNKMKELVNKNEGQLRQVLKVVRIRSKT